MPGKFRSSNSSDQPRRKSAPKRGDSPSDQAGFRGDRKPKANRNEDYKSEGRGVMPPKKADGSRVRVIKVRSSRDDRPGGKKPFLAEGTDRRNEGRDRPGRAERPERSEWKNRGDRPEILTVGMIVAIALAVPSVRVPSVRDEAIVPKILTAAVTGAIEIFKPSVRCG
ncbi:MAG: hypothetical protein HC781_11845 [Leptolyngbyaceae cyanobacterium CSU_1_4]|nr:hypothetical protein [Leptolyngbyaceae cyanobacterium CSU_1_4]